jgi:3',5'-cyclic-AMP phosphodiesterase
MDLTTVADDEAVVHDGLEVRTYDGLAPDTLQELDGFVFRTLPRPGGELLSRFATVNDVHFGEVECGIIEGLELGPTFRTPDGAEPYPEMMNRHAIAEIEAMDPDAVVVKGDLTSNGTEAEYQQFLDFYEPVFGPRLHHVRGNHESYHFKHFGPDEPYTVALPGVVLAVIDTNLDGRASGGVSDETLTWLRDTASDVERTQRGVPVLVFGHHHCWNPESHDRPEDYFGIDPDDSERLVEVMAAHANLRGYFAGHTHRNRVRRFSATRDVPWVEVAAVKEFPGTWAEYRVFEGGVLQIHRRISHPEALDWSEKTRGLYAGIFGDYAFGSLEDRCYVVTGHDWAS